ncbi:serine protease inhibitor 42Dd-like isoform X2 [Episyrphus balteatus]|nr:serine protease inhibitor 42Dd-like isoform X2 [Episyrphus balteatus]
MTSSASIDQDLSPSSSPNSGLFAADLLRIAKSKTSENVIFSPISIQTALAMTYMGAAGKTAEELKNGLRLPSLDKDQVGQYFSQLLNKKSGEADLSIANRIFVGSDYPLKADFNKMTENYFKSGAEALNFKDLPSEAIQTINSWVENKTNNKITDLMKPGSVDADTVALIVNAIYFKGKWKNPFSKDATRKLPFWINKDESVEVDMMYGGDKRIKYGEFSEINATAIEMAYKNSDISMMLILPNEKDGLADLENKLSSMSVIDLSSKMGSRKVDIMLPKFQINFSTPLSETLKEMGIQSLFQKADLPGMFESGPAVKVSDVQHKAFIDVNEAGSEAAAASFLQISLMSLDYDQRFFNADHPFFFAIKGPNTVYFVGHVAKP